MTIVESNQISKGTIIKVENFIIIGTSEKEVSVKGNGTFKPYMKECS